MFEPMLARSIEYRRTPEQVVAEFGRILHSPEWWFTQKIDGHRRAVTIGADGTITGWSRKGTRADLPADIRATLAELAVPATFDGELVDGHLWLFDLVAAGVDDRIVNPGMPYGQRFRTLEALIARWDPDPVVGLVPAARSVDEKVALFDQLSRNGGEGLVAKHISAPYRCGFRSPQWQKVKFFRDVDCVILSLGADKQNMQVGMYDPSRPPGKRWVQVGEVTRLNGDGLEAADLFTREQGKARPRRLVVTVKALYCPADTNHLVQPTKPRLRFDKRPTDCTIDQLDDIRPNKSVIPSLPVLEDT